MKPHVSVIVTTYNHGLYIGAALQSVLDQDYADREIIVVDDESTDDTAARVAEFDGKVVSLRQKNQGPAGARNTGIRHARGDLLAFLDGDDLWEPNKLSVQVRAAEEHPEAGMIVGDGVQFAGDEVLQSSIMPEMKTLLGSAGSLTLRCYRQLLERNFILTSSQVMIRRTVLDEVGLSDLRIPDASDWDLYLRIARRYDITFLSQSLTRWRYLAGSVSGPIHLRRIRWAPDDIAVLRKQLRQASPGDRPYIKRLLKERIFERGHEIYRYGRESDRGLARKQLLRCLRRDPTSSTLWAFLVGLHLPREASRRMWSVVRRVLGPRVR